MPHADDLIPGVDYDIGCCDLCGRTEMHDHHPDEYGTYYPLHEEQDQ